ncbi:ATP-binding protein [Pontiella agarivorans]|uniref:ATP-binding protein n=1 Tax=Pontiella agarivorans TaxID=3038953 RepID=A0ABU5MV23_9BACT|nr:ATP-binding protein [Pontiella agarivorans]MDZ8118005.1 ATP-binding protein [Pontiella agarivorans]
MKELVIISGKGGTGKTSITASFAALADHPVLVDCDVDAADLHLVLQPEIQTSETFVSGHVAEIRTGDCTQCGLCMAVCRFDAITDFRVDAMACEGCGACVEFCPEKAIDFPEQECGIWHRSKTRHGSMVHARMHPGAENSGKLVSLLRTEAGKLAERENAGLILVDGSPGIGCPVIASITGADAVLVVTEPTLSGEHDLKRVLQLVSHFRIPAMVCVNKWDINKEMTSQIEALAESMNAVPVGRVPYDAAVTAAQVNARALVESSDGAAARAVRGIWGAIQKQLFAEECCHVAS